MQKFSWIWGAAVLSLLQAHAISAQPSLSMRLVREVHTSSFAKLMNNPVIDSYDLSPDGKAVALLVADGITINAPLWLIVEDLPADRVIASIELGTSQFATGDFISQVEYSGDGRYLVVQDLRSIRVMESNSLQLVRTVVPGRDKDSLIPLFSVGASQRDIFAFAFGAPQEFDPNVHTTPAWVEVVDVSSGELLGNWASQDIPQAISPDGSLIAVSAAQPQQGLLPLDIVDIRGNKLTTVTGGFRFGRVDLSRISGRVVCAFIRDHELLLTPDTNVDRSGHRSRRHHEFHRNFWTAGKNEKGDPGQVRAYRGISSFCRRSYGAGRELVCSGACPRSQRLNYNFFATIIRTWDGARFGSRSRSRNRAVRIEIRRVDAEPASATVRRWIGDGSRAKRRSACVQAQHGAVMVCRDGCSIKIGERYGHNWIRVGSIMAYRREQATDFPPRIVEGRQTSKITLLARCMIPIRDTTTSAQEITLRSEHWYTNSLPGGLRDPSQQGSNTIPPQFNTP